MNQELIHTKTMQKSIVGALFAVYLAQLAANVGLASQYSFYQYASQGVAVGFYVSIVLIPLLFLIAYLALREHTRSQFELLYRSSLWTWTGVFLLSFVVLALRYLIEPYVDMGAWRELVAPVVAVGSVVGLIVCYLKNNHKQALLHKIIVSASALYLATLAIRPFLAAYRALIYANSGGSDLIFDMIFGTFPMFYYNFAPLIFIALLTLTGLAFTVGASLRRRISNTIVSGALAMITAETVQLFGNFFVSYSNDSPLYIAIHVVSYAMATGVFLYFLRLLEKSRV